MSRGLTSRPALVVAAALSLCYGAQARGDDFNPTLLGTRFLQTATPLTNEKGVFEMRVQHRFYQSFVDSGGGGAFGLDSSANVALGVEYAFVKNVSVSIIRTTLLADYEFAGKVTLLRPTDKLPLAIGVRGGVNWLTARYFKRQSSGFGQLIVAGTLGGVVTLGAAPSYTQRTPQEKKVWNIPLLMQVRVTKSIAAIGEFVPGGDLAKSDPQWSFGIEKNVYHHKFLLWIGNSGATTVDQLLAGDYNGGVRDLNLRIGFNITRSWDMFTD